jgi:hypothetical protein
MKGGGLAKGYYDAAFKRFMKYCAKAFITFLTGEELSEDDNIKLLTPEIIVLPHSYTPDAQLDINGAMHIYEYQRETRADDFGKYVIEAVQIQRDIREERKIYLYPIKLFIVFVNDAKETSFYTSPDDCLERCLNISITPVFLANTDYEKVFTEAEEVIDRDKKLPDKTAIALISSIFAVNKKIRTDYFLKILDVFEKLENKTEKLFWELQLFYLLYHTDLSVDNIAEIERRVKEMPQLGQELFKETWEAGKEENRKETAIELLRRNFPIETVGQITKLTKEEVEELKNNLS